MIDLSDVVNDPDLAQSFTVMRSRGQFVEGGFTSSACPIEFYGVIQPATDQDLSQVPEGDRTTGAMSFISSQIMYATRREGSPGKGGLSDTIEWRGNVYKVIPTTQWGDFGFWKAVGVRQS